MKHVLIAAAVATSLGGPVAAQVQPQLPQQQPQQTNLAGQWFCEWAFRNTAPGQPANPVGGNFNMIVQPNGAAQGQGTQMGSAGQFPFQFQGQVQLDGVDFAVIGQQQGGMAFGPSQFSFTSKVLDLDNMAYNNKNEAGQVFASACRRSG